MGEEKMQLIQYDGKKVKNAIKCYYVDKALHLGAFFRNAENARDVMYRYVHRCIIPDNDVAIDFLSIVLGDLDGSIYDLNGREKKERLISLHKEHFSSSDTPDQSSMRANASSASDDIE